MAIPLMKITSNAAVTAAIASTPSSTFHFPRTGKWRLGRLLYFGSGSDSGTGSGGHRHRLRLGHCLQ